MQSECNNPSLYQILLMWLFLLPVSCYSFTPGTDTIALPDSLLNYDAVVVSKEVTRHYRINSASSNIYLEDILAVKKKIKILTETGAKHLSQFDVSVNRFSNLSKLNVCVIKQNGTLRSVPNEYFQIQEPGDDINNGEKTLRMNIPDLETGDYVVCDMEIHNHSGFNYPIDLFFNEYVPILNFTYTLRFTNIVSQIKVYNNLPLPSATFSRMDSTYTWHFNYLPALLEEHSSIRENEIPFVRYMLLKVAKPGRAGLYGMRFLNARWEEIFENYTQIESFDFKRKKFDYFREFLAGQLKGTDSLTRFEKFQKIYLYLQDSIRHVDYMKKKRFCSGYYLFQKEIYPYAELRLYIDLFNYFNFEYYYVFARNKYKGKIDTDFVTSEMYDRMFLAFSNSGQFHFISISTAGKVGLDEILPIFQGTTAFLVKGTDPQDYEMIKLPEWTSDQNATDINGLIQVDPESLSLKMKLTTRFTGVSTLGNLNENVSKENTNSPNLIFEKNLKNIYSNLKIDDYHFEKRSLLFPYNFSYEFTGSQTEAITRIDKDIFSIPLSAWILHDFIPTTEITRKTDFYPNYRFSSTISYYLKFPYNIELLNADKISTEYKNGYGSFQMKVNQENDTTVLITSLYRLDTDYVPANDYHYIRDINNSWEQYREASLLIRKKNHNMNEATGRQ